MLAANRLARWSYQRGIKHLTGAPYYPATNESAERMVQSFKQSLKKSKLPPRPALQEFLMQYRRTPFNTGLSPSQLLNGRQLRTKIDVLLPSPAHIAQEPQACKTTKSQQKEQTSVQHVRTAYDVDTRSLLRSVLRSPSNQYTKMGSGYNHQEYTAIEHSPSRCIPGQRTTIWKRHLSRMLIPVPSSATSPHQRHGRDPEHPKAETPPSPTNVKTPDQIVPEYGRHNPRMSSRQRRPRQLFNAS